MGVSQVEKGEHPHHALLFIPSKGQGEVRQRALEERVLLSLLLL